MVSDISFGCFDWNADLIGILYAIINPLPSKRANVKNSSKIPNFILQNIEKQMVPCKSTAEEVSFQWLHHQGYFFNRLES